MLVTLLDRRSALHQSNLAGEITLRNTQLHAALANHASLAKIATIVVQQAQTMAFADAFIFLAAITLLLTPMVLLLRTPKRATPLAAAGE
jgi:hypothetical protein